MNELKSFTKNELQVSVLLIDGKEYFPATESATMLGYTNPQKAIRDHCKPEGVTNRSVLTQGGPQTMNFITEGNLYRLISRSKLPSAEKFESWVFDEVLPSIRKNGMYAKDELLDNPDLMLEIITKLKKERERNKALEANVTQRDQIIGELKPKADYVDRILKSTGLMTISQIAKDYGMSAQELNMKLYKLKIQYKQHGQWLLYKDHHAKGFTHSITVDLPPKNGMLRTKMHTNWTQKGRLFIYEELKKIGVVPMIERN